MSLNNKNKGSVAFIFYFIVGLSLLAIAGYYIGLHEQVALFESITSKRQQQENDILNATNVDQGTNSSSASNQFTPTKGLIDSPAIVLRNLRNGNTTQVGGNSGGDTGGQGAGTVQTNSGPVSVSFSPSVDQNSNDVGVILGIAKQSSYFIKTNESKNGTVVKLSNGEAKGDTCYNTATEKICYPYYSLAKVWSLGDLNGDGINDAIISVSALESLSAKKIVTNNFYAMISTSTKATKNSSATVSYNIASFNYGVYAPTVSSIEIKNGVITAIGIFYADVDAIGKPSLSKIIKYKVVLNSSGDSASSAPSASSALSTNSVTPYLIKEISQARLFKEQGEDTSGWYLYSNDFLGTNFSFRAPDTWQREQSSDEAGQTFAIALKTPDNRNMVFDARNVIITCSEYSFDLQDVAGITINDSEFIDLGDFGTGSYIKYTRSSGDTGGSNNSSTKKEYHADICVTDQGGDRKIFGLRAVTAEDDGPYFAMFDKIWSTFKIK